MGENVITIGDLVIITVGFGVVLCVIVFCCCFIDDLIRYLWRRLSKKLS